MVQSFNWHKEAEGQWDQRASFWNENSKEMWNNGSRKTIIPFFTENVPSGSVVADIGCGDGYGTFKLSEAGFHVTGMDISNEMIERARKQTKSKPNLDFVQGDMAALPFDDHSFDAVIAINSIEWTENPLHSLSEMHRILKDRGLLCLGLLGPTAKPRENSYSRLYGERVICNTMMPWEFQKLATENGWKVIDGHGVFKRGVTDKHVNDLPIELQQALTFMWVFILQK